MDGSNQPGFFEMETIKENQKLRAERTHLIALIEWCLDQLPENYKKIIKMELDDIRNKSL